MRPYLIVSLTLGTLAGLTAAQPPKTALPATEITVGSKGGLLGEVADACARQSGVSVAVAPPLLKAKVGALPAKLPFWDALQKGADAAGARIALSDGGQKVELVPRGAAREVASVNGAFRVVAQQVSGRASLDTGVVSHELTLLAHWEPRVRVYRIDSVPRITSASDDLGSKIEATGGGSGVLPGAATSEMKVRMTGVPRKSARLTAISGSFAVIAAERLLRFEFEAPAGKLPDAQKQGAVSARLTRVQKKADRWEVVVEVSYPSGRPEFESFQAEWWLRDNRLSLRSPQGKAVGIDEYEIPDPNRTNPLVVIHRFKENPGAGFGDPTAKGWALVYETPSPLSEFSVPFELKDVPLP